MLVIYGCTGYTGRLVVEEALRRGLRPVLAGRNGEALEIQAEAHELECRVAGLDHPGALDAVLEGAQVVLHCAGPFVHTWRAMSDACLRTRTHYLDITGEIAVFEGLSRRDAEAKQHGIMLLPGAGFDVVPSDCLAAHLARRVPGATQLSLAFAAGGGASQGTMRSAVEGLGESGAVRRGGRIVPVPVAWRSRRVDFGDGVVRDATTIPWGDVSTAFHSTGIPNIEVYMSMPPGTRRMLVASRAIAPLLRTGAARSVARALIARGAPGPSDDVRARAVSRFWGEAIADNGRRAEARLSAPSGYTLTAQTAVHLAMKALAGNAPAGFQTPSRAYGADVILEIPGTVRTDVA